MAVLTDSYTIRLHDTDAAGILFFANQFRIAHDIYERFMNESGFCFRDRFASRDFIIPIVHAEADFAKSLAVGDTIEVSLSVASVGDTSFTLDYLLTGRDGERAGTVTTVHVTVDPATMKKVPLPDRFRRVLEEASGSRD